MRVESNICGKPIDFKMDSGADVTVISEETHLNLDPSPMLTPAGTRLSCPGGPLTFWGQFSAKT